MDKKYHLPLLFWLLLLFSTLTSAADLSMNVSTSPAQGVLRQDLTYTVTLFPVRVGDSKVVNDVVLTYGLPPDFTLISATPSQGTCTSGDIVECEVGDLSDSQNIVFVVQPQQTGSVTSSFFASGLSLDSISGDVTTSKSSVSVTTAVSDPPPIEIAFTATEYSVSEDGSLASITVSRSGTDERAISVDFRSEDGTAVSGQDYDAATGTLAWTQGDLSDKSFSVRLIDDKEAERNETINLILENPVDADLGQANAVLTIVDDETTGQIEFSSVSYRVSEDTGSATITVVRNGGSDTAITVNYSTSNSSAIAGEDYTTAQGSLFWSHGDRVAKTFAVDIINNPVIEGDRALTLILSAADDAILGQRTATLTIVDEFSEEDAVAALESAARNPTQLAMAGPIGKLCQSRQAGTDLQALCRELILNAGSNPSAVANALQQWAPEEYATPGRMAVEFSSRQFRNISSRLMALRGGAAGAEVNLEDLSIDVQGTPLPNSLGEPVSGQEKPGSLPPAVAHKYGLNELGVFVSGNASFGSRDASDKESGFDFESQGMTLGLDYRVKDSFIFGAALGYGKAKSDFNQGGEIKADAVTTSFYTTFYKPKKFYLDAIFSLSKNSYDTRRNIIYQVADTQVNQAAFASPDGNATAFSLSGGYFFVYDTLNLIPTARFDYIHSEMDSFQENMKYTSATGYQLGLNMDSQSVRSMTLSLGAIASYEMELEWATLLPELRLDVIHEFENRSHLISGRFIHDGSGQRFYLPTDNPDKDYLSLAFSTDVEYGEGQMFYVSYQTLLGLNGITHHSIMGGVKLEY
ncbi:autotransporter domain-containing protein [Candidatus Venteria ishoeyi]|uniref:autotransporter domain-containing protein n=1 Tax=Candidatus Venteria ishoeyi TaxID=1899563 RepID=UPI0025A5B875|nr:autotransporter domain-containing protein [Candidatus Venteria ishoeyi]MDM8546217.1 autotransporter domain-containing protein [Candidatus Venteria ishoeyi]